VGPQVGDAVALVRGGQLPMMLRPTAHGRWRFMGECYVEGIMDGEAFDIDKCGEICIE
jgi:hypothetical protein